MVCVAGGGNGGNIPPSHGNQFQALVLCRYRVKVKARLGIGATAKGQVIEAAIPHRRRALDGAKKRDADGNRGKRWDQEFIASHDIRQHRSIGKSEHAYWESSAHSF